MIRLRRGAGGSLVLNLKIVGIAFAFAATCFAATPAFAVIKGTRTQWLAYSVVRLIGDGNCSGVVIARQAVATAAHCAHGMSVLADGRVYRVSRITKSGKLDDGTVVHVSGDAAILVLSRALPETMEAVPVGEGGGETFIIAGYGTTNERWRGAAPLHKAELVKAASYDLVDPARKGSIGASGCYGDSGGPVIRGGQLIGVITRASHPSPRIACGYLTRWAPISVSGDAAIAKADDVPIPTAKPTQRVRHSRPGAKPAEQNWLVNWLASNSRRAELDGPGRR